MRLSRLFLSLVCLYCGAANADAEKLVIMHTNDTHSQMDPTSNGLGGVSRRKVLIDSIRNVNPNTLLIDAGDAVQGSLFFNIYKGEVEEKIMNALGYDMRILGNHEFDNGLELLAQNLGQSEATLLASNYLTKGTPLEGLFLPYSIKDIDGKRIGFIPINLNPEGMISPSNYTGMGYADPIETANNLAWFLKNIEQVDKVIAITHIGYDPSEPPGDVTLAQKSSDIDVIIGGHTHTLIDPQKASEPFLIKNAKGRDVLVTQTGKSGQYLGEITIDLDDDEAIPEYRLISVDSRLDDRLDPEIEEILKPYRTEIDQLSHKMIGKTSRRLDKGSDDLLNWVADMVDTRGRAIADSVDFAIVNKGGIRNSLPKGDISEGDIIQMLPFFNRVDVIDILGKDLIPAFNQMAAVDGNGVSREVTAVYDPATDKCTEIMINGNPIDPEKKYRVATIDYLSLGGDYMPTLTHHTDVATSPNLLYEDIITYLRDGKGKGKKINPSPRPRMTPAP